MTPPEGVYRILSYGDSIGRGYKVDDSSHYPILLEQRLNAEGPTRYEVMNTARGSSPSIYAFHIKKDVRVFKPRMVLLEIELLNDLGDEALISYSRVDRWSLPTAINGARYLIGWQGVPISTIPMFGYSFETTPTCIRSVRGVGHLIERFRRNNFVSPESGRYYYHLWYDKFLLTERRISQARSRMFETIRGIRDYLKQKDIEFLLIILPSKYIFGTSAYRAHAAQEYQLALGEARKKGIPYVSLKKAMEEAGGQRLFMDFCHPKREGYQVISEELYRVMMERYFQPSELRVCDAEPPASPSQGGGIICASSSSWAQSRTTRSIFSGFTQAVAKSQSLPLHRLPIRWSSP